MTIQNLEPQLLALTANEKAQAMQILAQSLDKSWRGIEKTPGVCGGDACIAFTRIPVWVLVSATDLTNAWVYAAVNSEEIAIAIQENEAD
jgi:uncharacterized protein (DUF433 family)